jgi:hypothetical protein
MNKIHEEFIRVYIAQNMLDVDPTRTDLIDLYRATALSLISDNLITYRVFKAGVDCGASNEMAPVLYLSIVKHGLGPQIVMSCFPNGSQNKTTDISLSVFDNPVIPEYTLDKLKQLLMAAGINVVVEQ